MTLVTTTMESAADYADAMITLRKAKSLLWWIATSLVFLEIVLFFVARYGVELSGDTSRASVLKDLVAVIDFLGLIIPAVLDVTLFLIVSIMLLGRLIGVSKLVSAFLWCVLVTLLMFPWQALLSSNELKIPGVLYNWTELVSRAKIKPEGLGPNMLFWARFVLWPAVTLYLLVLVHSQSRRGLRLAFRQS